MHRLRFLLCCILILPGISAAPVARVHAATTVPDSWVVMLDGDPLAAVHATGIAPASVLPAANDRKEEITRQQDAIEREIVALGGRVTSRFDTLLNAVVVGIPESGASALSGLTGVRSVRRERQFSPLLASSVPFIGAPEIWTRTTGGGAGTGIRIAIIDSGIDYLHADFGGPGDPDAFSGNDPTVIESGSFPTAKVIGGYDFVGDDFDGSGDSGFAATRPVPDPDPLDPASNGHGTHVAGIAAGTGVLTNGVAYTGPYSANIDLTAFQVGPGVAPRALLYAYKVFGRQGSTTFSIVARALERSLDPDQNGSFGDHVDVVNLSLGSPFGLADDLEPEVAAVNRLSQQGVIVVVAAGNNGNTHYVCGTPGVAARAVTVANSFDDGATFSSIRVNTPAVIAGDYAAVEGAFTPPLSSLQAITAQVIAVSPANACGTLLNPSILKGSIALIDRGTCFFVDKVRRAQLAGALGVIVVNNAEGAPIEMGGQGDTSDIHIPAVMISRIDGSVLKAQAQAGLTVTLAAFGAIAHPELADQLSDSSSRGPSAFDGNLKPDVAAPGTGIFSAKGGSGTGGLALTGTSMAAPHVAGAAALLREARPTWSVEDIKALLMNTATPTRSPLHFDYPESRGGAGRIRLREAIRSQTIARSETGSGGISLSFGSHQLPGPMSLTRSVQLVNHGAFAATYRVAAGSTIERSGVRMVPLVTSITVPARGSVLVPVRLDLDPTGFSPAIDGSSSALVGDRPRLPLEEASGEVRFENDSTVLRLPWHVVARATGEHHATALEVGVPAAARSTLSLPTRGSAAHPKPLVSVFQLGYEHGPGDGDSGNLVAAGVATDSAGSQIMEDAHLYFGLATAGDWISPQYEWVALEVEIDLDDDGIPEYVLLNSSGGNLNGQGFESDLSNDALMSLVFDVGKSGTDRFLSGGGVLNVLQPAFRDTAPYNNRVAILSATARQLGLGSGRSRFLYRVTATGLGSRIQTESPWIGFDLAHPLLDATPYGLLGTSIFDEGRGIRVDLDRDAAVHEGYGLLRPLKALLLHQHNNAGSAVEMVSLRMDSPDIDRDGLSDAWELEWLGDLSETGSGDPDRDGSSNAIELAAGTNPMDIRMLPPAMDSGTLRWIGNAGVRYTVQRAARLRDPFETVAQHLPGMTGTNTMVDPALGQGTSTGYYRVFAE